MNAYSVSTSDFVNLTITNSGAESNWATRRFRKGITIHELKGNLELLTGGNPATMTVELYDDNDKFMCKLDEEERLLGSYPANDGMRIHVVDNFAAMAPDALSNVQKFEISEEEYAKKQDTVKAYLEKNKLGKYNEEDMRRKAEEKKLEEEMEERLASLCKVGDRCEVSTPNQPRRRATVLYIGKTEFKEGWWIGVKYDEPLGKNNGSVNGKKYFECPPKYGGFVKPAHVKVGDFPEEDFNMDEEL
ncbi:PREDICTED: tubulin-folding cofactor B [Vollenhovia emeryi]|uniref:tubulin-folding cofactor B n=1 Tax=Vollenhovia emeryi TaxID=411798 RepID=UPI0005F51583|nr:PREDICTED: tubulin-folding cofactor B [Vollenhovia emeryi]XP_011872763.1 PREDICTED: tubulin-folding cofactor B [Vollenhovia emeryi]XP_011872764.1 PREDICTED: tubulin-folding cofactor B [Vollenhovia emeryi]XP_011872766.1 PREDICTED: tubulin-folding cofactor B [Vollenhovia emeryi]